MDSDWQVLDQHQDQTDYSHYLGCKGLTIGVIISLGERFTVTKPICQWIGLAQPVPEFVTQRKRKPQRKPERIT